MRSSPSLFRILRKHDFLRERSLGACTGLGSRLRDSRNILSPCLSRFSKTVKSALPFWALVLLIGFVPVRALEIIDYFVAHAVLSASILGAYLIFSLFIIYFLYSLRFIRTRTHRLNCD